MYSRLNRKGAATAATLLCMGLTTGFLALNTGCSTANPSSYKDPAPSISAFTTGSMATGSFVATDAGKTLGIAAGDSATLRANFGSMGGTAVVNPGNYQIQSNVPLTINNILTSTSYTLTVTSDSGKVTTATTKVDVLAAPSGLVYAKESPTYYVGVQVPVNTATVVGATPMSFSVKPALPAGLSLDANTGAVSGIPQTFTAAADYIITAKNAVGSTTHPLNINIAATPLSMVVSPAAIALGQSAILTWSGNSVPGLFSSVSITASPADASLPASFALAGSATVTPGATTTYTITAVPATGGPGVTSSADITVGTSPVHITSLSAAPSPTLYGGSATLTWSLTGIPSVLTLDNNNVLGSLGATVSPVKRQTFTLAGSNNLGSDSRTITVAARGMDVVAGVPSGQGLYDGKGIDIRFAGPGGMATDNAGNIYWAELYGNTVRMITPDGQAKTIAGTPGITGASTASNGANLMNKPYSVAVAPDGSVIYVADSVNCLVRKITKDATSGTYTMTVLAGVQGVNTGVDGAFGTGTFGAPQGIALDPTGKYLLVADNSKHTIRQVTVADGSILTYAGTGAPGYANASNAALTTAAFKYPSGVTFNHAGTAFYVNDSGNYAFRMVNWSPASTAGPTGSSYTLIGGVNGTPATGFVDGASGTATMSSSYSSVVDSNENVYVGDYANGLIRKVVVNGNSGTVSTLAGTAPAAASKDGVGSAAIINKPQGVTLVNGGATLLIAEQAGSGTIRSLNLATMAVTTPYGMYKNAGMVNGTWINATFSAPVGLATDSARNVYVVDKGNHAIRKITPAGVTTTIAGTGAAGNVDGSGTLAQFSAPIGIAVDAQGIIYVADTGNKAVRKIVQGATDPVSGVTAPATVSTLVTLGTGPTGIAVDPTKAGRIFVTNGTTITPIDGTATGTAITASSPAFSFGATLAGIVCDANGDLYVADRGNSLIRKISSPLSSPTVVILAGQTGVTGRINGALATNTLNGPAGIGIDPFGNIFFNEPTNHMVRMLDSTGTVSTVINNPSVAAASTIAPGTGAGVLPGSISTPQGLAVNADGDILVTSTDAVMQVTAPANK